MDQHPEEGEASQSPASKRDKRAKKAARLHRKEEIAAEALRMRLAGFTFREIGAELGADPQLCSRLVKAEMAAAAKRKAEDAEDAVILQDMRLERMLAALDKQIQGGSPRAIEIGLKVLERQAKLHGYDAPERSVVAVAYARMSDEDLIAEATKARVELSRFIPPAATLLPGETPRQDIIEACVVERDAVPLHDASPKEEGKGTAS